MIEVEIEDAAWTSALPDAAGIVERAALAALEGQEGTIIVLLADDAAVRDLNARFRDRDAATNVLSFPAAATARPHLGDVALAYGVCAREAEAQGKPLAHHLMHLTAHGVLHLLGYDHQSDAEAEEMEEVERRILQGLGAPDPYRGEGGPDAG
jgi:probable rRNA maturation factor